MVKLLLLLATQAFAANQSADNFLAYKSVQCFDPASRSKSVKIQSPTLSAGWTFTLPTTAGSNLQCLQTNGSGVTSWASPTGGITIGTFGSTPNANGLSYSDPTLNMQPADATHPGGVSTGAQTFAGAKTFSSAPTFSTMTLGSVLFSGTGGLLSQNNSEFFWDNSNNTLILNGATIYAGTPALLIKSKSDGLDSMLQLESTSGTSYLDLILRDNGDTFLYNRASGNSYAYWANNGFMSLGQIGGTRSFNITGTNASTTITTPVTVNAQGINDYDSTDGNFSPLYFQQFDSPDSAVIGVHDSHAAGAHVGSLHFMTTTGSTFQESASISGPGILKINGGILQLPPQASSSTPTCASSADSGKLALTSAFILCVCNASAWVQAANGTVACTF